MKPSADVYRRRLKILGDQLEGRDELVRDAHAAGVTKTEIHRITGIARTTIDRITGDRASLETRIRAGLADAAEQIEPSPDALDTIRQRIEEES